MDELKTRAHEVVTEGHDSTSNLESSGHSVVTRVNDQDKLYLVESGSLDVVISDDQTVQARTGAVHDRTAPTFIRHRCSFRRVQLSHL